MVSAAAVSTDLSFLLNGETVEVRDAAVHATLLDFLRARGLTGAKEGCAEGECGACAVVMVQPSGAGSVYKPVNSCLFLLPMAAGHEFHTVEALARNGALHPAQAAMAAAGGSQCGYCTPGFVMSLFAEYYRPGRSGPCETKALGGNLCRCTGYRPIRDAASSLGPASADHFTQRLSRPAAVLQSIDGAGFARPTGLAHALEILATDRNARPIAGATDLAVESNLKSKRFGRLVSLEAIPELRVFHDAPDAVEIGAALTLDEIGSRWQGAPPVIGEWLDLFASPLIRHRATLGGNLATASPIGDSAPLLLALDAELRIAGPTGERVLPLASFFTGYRQTALGPGEIIVSVRVPKPFPDTVRFYKVAKRRLDDISTVAAAFAIRFAAGVIESARIAYGGVAAVPTRVPAAEAQLAGRPWRGEAFRSAQGSVARALQPLSDHRGSGEYRLAMAQSLLAKFHFEEARAA
jgi:xanthine dehydrogenase small subunit